MDKSRSYRSIWQSSLLILALLWTPIWGQWHAIEHTDLQAKSAPHGLHPSHAHEDHKLAPTGDQFGHAAGSDLCKILDHLATSDGLGKTHAAWSSPMVAAPNPIRLAAVFSVHDRWALPQARAPPGLI